ncbi:MAG: TonB-dependent receptor [Bacteroidales bacterium]|nr:TonB-dependent receptor [Bacteroidales bacterium]
MKKVYLLVLLIFASIAASAQHDEQVIERNIFDIDDVILPPNTKTHVVRALRSNKDIDEQPVTIYTISHDDIVRNGYITLADVLKMVPGIRVSQPQSGELGEAFMQRGLLGNTYTKILLNDVDMKPQGNYGMPLGANIPIRQAEEIQIIYGPASASYGNDACSGVINIKTRTPESGQFTSADVMLGTGNSCYINFHSGAKLGHGKYVSQLSFYGSNIAASKLNVPTDDDLYNRWNYFMQNGEDLEINIGDQNLHITRDMLNPENFEKLSPYLQQLHYYNINYVGSADKPFYTPEICEIPQRATQLGAEYTIASVKVTYNMMHRMDFADLGQSPFTYNWNEPRNMLGEYIHRFTVNSDVKYGNLTSNTSARYIIYRMDKNSSRGVNWNKGPQYAYAASDEVGVEENINWEVFNNVEKSRMLTLNAGASWQYYGVLPPTLECERKFDFDAYSTFSDKVEFEDPVFGSFGVNPYNAWQAGAYLLADLDFKRLSISGGTRYDYSSLWEHSVNPRISALYRLADDNRITLRASYGSSYKVPSPAQIYYCVGVAMEKAVPGLPYTIAVHHIPSDTDDIHPEKISSYEVGLRYYFRDKNGAKTRNYFEFVGYNNTVQDPLVRSWVRLDRNIYPTPYYVGVTDFFSSTKGRDWTRAYANEKDAKTQIYSLQGILVLNDIFETDSKNFKLGLSASYTHTFGYEKLYNNAADENADDQFMRVSYVRGTPERQAQVIVDMDLIKRFHLRLDNSYCSKIARTYYQASENPYFWAPAYYNLDVSLTIKINERLNGILRVTNVTDALYGGIDVKNMDVDLPFNPQYGRSLRFGITYDF